MLNAIDIGDKIPLESAEELNVIESLGKDVIPMDLGKKTPLTAETNLIAAEKTSQKLLYKILEKVQEFLSAKALPLFLLIGVMLGAFIPQIGVAIDHKVTSNVCLVIMFLYSGLYLSTTSILEAFKAYKAAAWGTLSILCVTCVIGAQLTSLYSFHVPSNLKTNMSFLSHINETNQNLLYGNETAIHNVDSFRAGLIVYFSTPCTVSSGILMVTQIDGNTALAVMLTIVTNIVGIFTTPLFLKWILTIGSQIKLDVSSLLLNLSLCLLLPILVGKSLRFIKFVKTFISNPNCKFCLMLCSVTALAIIILIQVSKTSSNGELRKLTLISTLAVIGWTLAMHFIFLLLNGLVSWILRLERKQLKCIVVLASQKTVTIASAILTFIPVEFGDRGLMAIAIVVGHLSILLFDSFLIPFWLYIEKKYNFCGGSHSSQEELK
ncbi:uncharacterized protein LOC136092305 [Hydra vulgaris]|uniref:Uncharacterized protein LOC136092305 n=1 Tax=Hydra vulgaris TaxID=6087 RepID=A0ABM4DNZ7_HYDVU